MLDSTIQLLELPEVRRRVAGHAAFTRSQELARELAPASDPARVRARLARTAEARRLLAMVPTFGVGSAHDVRTTVAMAARGSRLDAPAFLAVHDQLRAVLRARQSLAKVQDATPDLWSIVGALDPLTALQERIGLTVDESGAVLDSASDALAQIRGKLRRARAQVERLLQRLVGSPETQRLLQEPIVTERNGRLVVPVRVESKSAFPGIVHDASASGQTLFMEPLAAVEANNEVRELQAAEQHEIERVLLELSGLIGTQESMIVAGVEGLAALDLALAMARYAEALQAVEPLVGGGDGFELRGARHPLLSDPVVPIDVAVRPDETDGYRALVITGPNTGGKTVALKTVGLLHLMAACGLHLPVQDGSRVAVYERILADIGDEQSIAQSLSTFASHLRRLVAMVNAAGPRTLALADELGAGTDPTEGAALAQAILDRLLAAGAVCVVTSHHPELKSYAYRHPLARNASVEFDIESLRPTYRLVLGIPGKSNALAIAERLGLDSSVIAGARRRLARSHHDTEDVIAAMNAERVAAERARGEAQAEAHEAMELRRRLQAELADAAAEREALLRTARREARALLREARAA
ncbi:MAG: endonuclease MutS2, partial [Actinobacteria bacterium]|nr:endonuclease MutS2 [Actinomycetota bacterium]